MGPLKNKIEEPHIKTRYKKQMWSDRDAANKLEINIFSL